MKNTISLCFCVLLAAGCKEVAPKGTTESAATGDKAAKPAAASVSAKELAAAKAKHPGCECGKGNKTMWCDKCGMGFIDGKPERDKAKVMAAVAAKGGDGHAHKACGCDKGKEGHADKACGCKDKGQEGHAHKACGCDKGNEGGKEGHADKACGCDKGKAGHGSSCACAEGKKGGTAWCAKCNKGFIAGKVETDKAKVMAAVAKKEHAEKPVCGCAEGKKGGTLWCAVCKMGFIAGEVEMDRAKVMAAVAKANK